MVTYAILANPGHNRVYFDASRNLSLSELTIAGKAFSTVCENFRREEIEGIPYYMMDAAETLSLLLRDFYGGDVQKRREDPSSGFQSGRSFLSSQRQQYFKVQRQNQRAFHPDDAERCALFQRFFGGRGAHPAVGPHFRQGDDAVRRACLRL